LNMLLKNKSFLMVFSEAKVWAISTFIQHQQWQRVYSQTDKMFDVFWATERSFWVGFAFPFSWMGNIHVRFWVCIPLKGILPLIKKQIRL
jgi:hypothetical protein